MDGSMENQTIGSYIFEHYNEAVRLVNKMLIKDIHVNSLTAVSVYIRPHQFSCAKKIVKNQPFFQKSRKIHQTVEN